MPLCGVVAARLLRLPDELALGVILVAVCPGGTASNVIAYLARADVALSVSMTAASTLLAPLLTPLLLQLWAGRLVAVPFAEQARTIAQIVLLPVAAGLVARVLLERGGRTRLTAHLLAALPVVSVGLIVLIVACIVARNRDGLAALGPGVIAAVALTNAAGLALGYGLARAVRLDRRAARTVAIEVGMQNSGLGVALATAFFPGPAALPSAFYSLWHNLTGPALATYWRRLARGESPGAPAA
jgi:BASS family bile acid:Na+ symporter